MNAGANEQAITDINQTKNANAFFFAIAIQKASFTTKPEWQIGKPQSCTTEYANELSPVPRICSLSSLHDDVAIDDNAKNGKETAAFSPKGYWSNPDLLKLTYSPAPCPA